MPQAAKATSREALQSSAVKARFLSRAALAIYKKMDGGGVEEGDASGLLARGCSMRSAQGYRRPRELTGPPLSKSNNIWLMRGFQMQAQLSRR